MGPLAPLRRYLLAAWPALLLGAGLLTLLAAFVPVDPPAGVTVSSSPYTDEGWDVVNARNLIVRGDWSTDDWNLHLVNTPFSVLQAAVFRLAGVGIVQARLLPILAIVTATLLLGLGLTRPLGRIPAFIAAVALGTSALVLYYGRLAYLEPVVVALLVAGFLTLDFAEPRRAALLGLLGGVAFALAAGTKPLALLSVAGLMAGVLVVDLRNRAARWWSAGVVVALAVGLAGWLLVVALPHLHAVRVDLAIWAPEPLPGSLRQLATLASRYVTQSDGAITLALPLLSGGLIGLALCVARWGQLTPVRRRMAAAATGWALVGIGTLLVVSYRPNRYIVPALPALAVLIGVGVSSLVEAAAAWRAPLRWAGVAGLLLALAAPGLVLNGRWLTTTPTSLPALQARFAGLLPAGAMLQGAEAPTVGMTSQAILLVSRSTDRVNAGDLYTAGVRWVVGRPDNPADVPAWTSLHRAAWEGRREVFCFPWSGTRFCVWELP